MAKDVVGIGIIGTGFARTTQLPGWAARAAAPPEVFSARALIPASSRSPTAPDS